MNKYPAIYESEIGNIYFYANKSTLCYILDGELHDWCFLDCAEEQANDKNITHEYLANTYGEVVSPEHAEFIIELCKVGDIDFVASKKGISKFKYFRINESYLGFYTEPRNAKSQGPKKITIPLPPKQIQTATPEEEFEMKQIMKNAGDNLVLGCEDSKCDEWPCVGSIVTWGNKSVKGEIKALSDGLAWIKNEYSNYCSEYVSSLLKPKTPEEELRDELFNCKKPNLDTLQAEDLSQWLITNYEIKKKPQ